MDNQMTEEQIDNWRKLLCLKLGAYALIMPVQQIYNLRDRLQGIACETEENPFKKEKKPKPKHNPFKSQEEFDAKNNWFQKALKKGEQHESD